MCPDAEFDEETLDARVRSDPEAALDLLLLEAAARPRDLGLRRGGGPALHALPAVQLDRPAPRRHRLAEGGLEPRPDAVPPQHPLRRADQARGRRHAAPLVHVHLRRHRLPDEDPREPRRRGGRRHLQHRQSRQRPLGPGARRSAGRGRRGVSELRRAARARRAIVEVSSRRLLRRGLPGHPDARAVDPARARRSSAGSRRSGWTRRSGGRSTSTSESAGIAVPSGRGRTDAASPSRSTATRYVGTRDGVPRLLEIFARARDPRDVLLHARSRPVGRRRRGASSRGPGFLAKMLREPRGVALRVSDDALRDAAAGAA